MEENFDCLDLNRFGEYFMRKMDIYLQLTMNIWP
jgi:hypothetical protein